MQKGKVAYVDGFVLVVPKKKINAYRKMARDGGEIWIRHGALEYKECMLSDPKPPYITLTFPKMTKTKPSETVWFSYIGYKSKKHRDLVNKKVMKEMQSQSHDHDYMKDMPFDMKRMAYGGFTVEVDV